MALTLKIVKAKNLLDDTLAIMQRLAWEAKSNPLIKKFAVKITNDAGLENGRDKFKAATAIAQFIGSNIKFYNDPFRTETLQTPIKTIELEYGDCDDHAILMAALLMSLGIETRYRVVGRGRPEHVFTEAMTEKGWWGFDSAATSKDPKPDTIQTYRYVNFRGNTPMLTKSLTGFFTPRNFEANLDALDGYDTRRGLGDDTDTSLLADTTKTGLFSSRHADRQEQRVLDQQNKKAARTLKQTLRPELQAIRKAVQNQVKAVRKGDAITQVGTTIEQEAGAPVVITVDSTGENASDVSVTALPSMSPLDVTSYEASATATGAVITPVITQGQKYLSPDEPENPVITYDVMTNDPSILFGDNLNYLSTPDPYGTGLTFNLTGFADDPFADAGLGELGNILASALNFVKAIPKKIVGAVKNIPKQIAYNKQVKYEAADLAKQAGTKTVSKAVQIYNKMKGAGLSDAIMSIGSTLLIEALQTGDSSKIEKLANDNKVDLTRPPQSSGIPTWLIPAGIGVGVYFLIKSQDKKRR